MSDVKWKLRGNARKKKISTGLGPQQLKIGERNAARTVIQGVAQRFSG